MTLFEKINDLMYEGYSIEFKKEWFNFHIVIRHLDLVNGKNIKDESSMPLQDHFTENRILECIYFQVGRIQREIENEKLKTTVN